MKEFLGFIQACWFLVLLTGFLLAIFIRKIARNFFYYCALAISPFLSIMLALLVGKAKGKY